MDGPHAMRGASRGRQDKARVEKRGARLSNLTVAQSTTLSNASYSIAQGEMNLAVVLVHPCPQEPKQIVKEYGGLLEGREL